MQHQRLTTNTSSQPAQFLHQDCWQQSTLALVEQELKTPPYQQVLPNKLFSKEELQKLPAHNWMQSCDFNLISPDNTPDLDAFLEQLRNEAQSSPEFVRAKNEADGSMKLLALDLETTGLDKTIKIIGGHPTTPSLIVGVCIATSDTKGYYLPVMHNQKDGIHNYSFDEIIDFLRKLQEFRIIYHNASYDREILETHNIDLNPEYTDTMLIAINLGIRDQLFTVGLKQMSEHFLHRKMLEINELSGEKKYIPLQYYPASSVFVYGCSDAVNTYGLFKLLTKGKDNPYIVNRFPMRLDMKTADYSRWMLRYGMPTDFQHLKGSLKTLIRRKIILESKFAAEISQTVPIGSAEKVGIFLGELLLADFINFKSKDATTLTQDQIKEQAAKTLQKEFLMEVKNKKLASGQTKTTFATGAAVLEHLAKIKDKNLQWVQPNTAEIITKAVLYIDRYRNVSHDIGVFLAIYRYTYVDDLNIHRISIGIKFNGTTTNRYSNQSGKGSMDRYSITRGTKKTTLTYNKADSVAGLNIQGVSSAKLQIEKAYKVVAASPEFLAAKKALDQKVGLALIEMLEAL